MPAEGGWCAISQPRSVKPLAGKKNRRIKIPIVCRRGSAGEDPHRFTNFGIFTLSCSNCLVLCPHSGRYDGSQDSCSSASSRDHTPTRVLSSDSRAIPSPSTLLVYRERLA